MVGATCPTWRPECEFFKPGPVWSGFGMPLGWVRSPFGRPKTGFKRPLLITLVAFGIPSVVRIALCGWCKNGAILVQRSASSKGSDWSYTADVSFTSCRLWIPESIRGHLIKRRTFHTPKYFKILQNTRKYSSPIETADRCACPTRPTLLTCPTPLP